MLYYEATIVGVYSCARECISQGHTFPIIIQHHLRITINAIRQGKLNENIKKGLLHMHLGLCLSVISFIFPPADA
jgi:hypothetical protein